MNEQNKKIAIELAALPSLEEFSLEKRDLAKGMVFMRIAGFVFVLAGCLNWSSPYFIAQSLAPLTVGALAGIASWWFTADYKKILLAQKNTEKLHNDFSSLHFNQSTMGMIFAELYSHVDFYGSSVLQEKREIANLLLQDKTASDSDKVNLLAELFALLEKKKSFAAIDSQTLEPTLSLPSTSTSIYHYAK